MQFLVERCTQNIYKYFLGRNVNICIRKTKLLGSDISNSFPFLFQSNDNKFQNENTLLNNISI